MADVSRIAPIVLVAALAVACSSSETPPDYTPDEDVPDAGTDAADAPVDRGGDLDATIDVVEVVLAPDAVDVADVRLAPDVPDILDVADDRGAPAGCGSLPLCEDFESSPVGGVPSAARWTVVSPNCHGSGRLAVDGAVAHGGARSLRIDGGGGYCDHVFLSNESVIQSLGPVVYGRLYVRFSDALGDGHVTFLTMRDAADGPRDLRLGGQSRIFMWNRESDDATLPELSPAGIARSLRPAASSWRCVEFRVDQSAGTLSTWVDGAAVEGLTIDATATPDVDARWLSRGAWRPRLVDLKLGWESYAGQSMTVWFDDVALGRERIGCLP